MTAGGENSPPDIFGKPRASDRPDRDQPLPQTPPKRNLVIGESTQYVRGQFHEKRTAVPTRQRYLILLLVAGASAFEIAAVPSAAADCVSAAGPNPLTLCSQGETRVSNRTPLPRATPYIPLDCAMDWLCDQGLGIALSD